MFAAAGKFLKKLMLLCLSPHFCYFLYLNSASKVGFPPLFLKISPPPFGFPYPKIYFQIPSLFEIFKIWVPLPLLKGREHTMNVTSLIRYQFQKSHSLANLNYHSLQQLSIHSLGSRQFFFELLPPAMIANFSVWLCENGQF